MKPFLINTLGSNEPSYRVFNSIYAGTYVINRNNTVGENFYNNWSSSGTFSLFNFYNYKHWADDQRLALDIRNNSTQFAAGFRILISGFGLIFADVLNPNTPNPYPSSLVYYASLPGNSTGSYHPSSINTNFSFKIFALWDVSNPPPGSLNFNIVIVSDYDKGFMTNDDLLTIGKNSKVSILDSKRKLSKEIVDSFTFVKLNEKESLQNSDLLECKNILVTLGSKGTKFNDEVYPSPNPQETIDVSGAGDTIYSTAGAPLTVTDTSPSIFINLSVDYWRCLNILVIIN